MSREKENKIYFVGAGPGDPELITVKGRRLLDRAEVIIYTGSLVPAGVIQNPDAEIHNSAGMTLDEVIDIMREAWQAGKRVVRLHTGDPSIFGAIGEQMARLAAGNIPWQVVPGVSSVTAVAAALSIELTLPEVSQTVIITRRAGRTPVPGKENLADLAGHQATMLILLSAGMIDAVVTDLYQGGYPAGTPVAVVEKASWPEERIVRGTLETIGGLVRRAGITKTAIIVVGETLTKGTPPSLSKLYDRDFSHGCRKASREKSP
ncbi:MAG: precorrin-4 C(11)-methyltransferase [Desulfobacterales bacterium]|nr:precorrin-4 C(11)-methyltransferase [Desulfobacterales bacterium]